MSLNKIKLDAWKILFIFVGICFSSLFILSFFKIINFWTFSQAHLNYYGGFVKRGLFGTLMLISEKHLNIERDNFFNFFFVIFHSFSIIVFFSLLKKYSFNLIILIFLALNPALIMFAFNDIGGFQRFDILTIFNLLLHTYFTNKLLKNEIDEKYYEKFLYFLYFLIFISILIHEIQAFAIPFHFLLSHLILKNKKLKNINKIYFVLIFIFSINISIFGSADNNQLRIIQDNSPTKFGIWSDAILFASGHYSHILTTFYELKINLLNPYNLRISLFFILITLVVNYSILFYFSKNKKILNPLFNNPYSIFFIISPFFLMFYIGDVGRWIHLMAITSFCSLTVNPINKKINRVKIFDEKNGNLFCIKIFFLVLVLFYCIFTRVPHCCDLEKKNKTIFGGLINKFVAVGHILISEKKENILDTIKIYKD